MSEMRDPLSPAEQEVLQNLPGHTVLGPRREMNRGLLRHGTSINMATWAVLVKATKASLLAPAGKSPPLDPLYLALRRKRSADARKTKGSVPKTPRKKRRNGHASKRFNKLRLGPRQKRSAGGKRRLLV
jgi:hypothetical protein